MAADKRIFKGVFHDLKVQVFGRPQTLRGEFTVYVKQFRVLPAKWGGLVEGCEPHAQWEASSPECCMELVRHSFERTYIDFSVGEWLFHGWQPIDQERADLLRGVA